MSKIQYNSQTTICTDNHEFNNLINSKSRVIKYTFQNVEDGRTMKIDGINIRFTKGETISFSKYYGDDVYGKDVGRIAFFIDESRNKALTHDGTNLQINPFLEKDQKFSWQLIYERDENMVVKLYNDYSNTQTSNGSYVGYDSNSDSVKLVDQDSKLIIKWKIIPIGSLKSTLKALAFMNRGQGLYEYEDLYTQLDTCYFPNELLNHLYIQNDCQVNSTDIGLKQTVKRTLDSNKKNAEKQIQNGIGVFPFGTCSAMINDKNVFYKMLDTISTEIFKSNVLTLTNLERSNSYDAMYIIELIKVNRDLKSQIETIKNEYQRTKLMYEDQIKINQRRNEEITKMRKCKAVSNYLGEDWYMEPGDRYVVSLNKKYVLKYQHDGNLVLYYASDEGKQAIWASGVLVDNPLMAILQKDGNFVLYDTSMKPYWATSFGRPLPTGKRPYKLILQDDRNLVLYDSRTIPYWSSGTHIRLDMLDSVTNNTLNVGDAITSANGLYYLIYQSDGSLVLYRKRNNERPYIMWSNQKFFRGRPGKAVLESDGNLALFDSNGLKYWHSVTYGRNAGPYTLQLQDDGNLVLSDKNGKFWFSFIWLYPDMLVSNINPVLKPGDRLVSKNRKNTLLYQGLSNLVLYTDVNKPTAIWAVGTVKPKAGVAVLESNGNFVLYDEAHVPYWSTNTANVSKNAPYRLVVKGDNTLVLYDNIGQTLWSTGTAIQPRFGQKIEPVTVYEHCGFQGKKRDLLVGEYRTPRAIGLANDTLSSVKIPPGRIVELYEHDNFQGRSLKLNWDVSCLVNNNFNDIVSSIRIT